MAQTDDRPLTLDDLTGYFAQGCKPKSYFRVGAEHEKFGFQHADRLPPPYEGEHGVHALMLGLQQRFGWEPVMEGPTLIGLHRGGANVSLEPGGQFELSGAPLADMHAIDAETRGHLDEVAAVAGDLGLGYLALGFHPTVTREQTPVMPKGRYAIMRRYMPLVGGQGLDMMFRTCTVQANLDFASEADMVAKFRTSLALQPIATALFANSPFREGKPTGFLSTRANVWTDTDPDRTGMLDFVFEDGFGFEAYARYALNVPMYFVKRGDTYIDVAGQSFGDFIDGKLEARPGERASIKDWADHVTTIFPEVRLKSYLEMRGADSGPADMLVALPALWTGLLYDDAALAAAWDLCKGWSAEDHVASRGEAARHGLKGKVAGRSMRDVAVDVVAIAREGLQRRGLGEEVFLAPLEAIADSGVTLAERWLEKFNGPWGGSVQPIFEEAAYF
ncbi:MAG: glutamate--cysteine ligase [Caulobacterales bacterium 68-7]|nr:glutamate--cysteine ligase [Caulobacterales bacterium]OJU11934.1 MAG: glutamate--cysteine ligase [Caulobacterales bacterium 68-7]